MPGSLVGSASPLAGSHQITVEHGRGVAGMARRMRAASGPRQRSHDRGGVGPEPVPRRLALVVGCKAWLMMDVGHAVLRLGRRAGWCQRRRCRREAPVCDLGTGQHPWSADRLPSGDRPRGQREALWRGTDQGEPSNARRDGRHAGRGRDAAPGLRVLPRRSPLMAPAATANHGSSRPEGAVRGRTPRIRRARHPGSGPPLGGAGPEGGARGRAAPPAPPAAPPQERSTRQGPLPPPPARRPGRRPGTEDQEPPPR